MTKPLRLAVSRLPNALPLEQRGVLMTAAEISLAVFNAKKGRKWVLANVPRHYRHALGRDVLYYENEVRLWIETTRQAA